MADDPNDEEPDSEGSECSLNEGNHQIPVYSEGPTKGRFNMEVARTLPVVRTAEALGLPSRLMITRRPPTTPGGAAAANGSVAAI